MKYTAVYFQPEKPSEILSKNGIANLKVFQEVIDMIEKQKFDLLLANITKNVLMIEIPDYS